MNHTHMKIGSISLLKKYTLEQRDANSHPTDWQFFSKMTMSSVGEDTEQRELWNTVWLYLVNLKTLILNHQQLHSQIYALEKLVHENQESCKSMFINSIAYNTKNLTHSTYDSILEWNKYILIYAYSETLYSSENK